LHISPSCLTTPKTLQMLAFRRAIILLYRHNLDEMLNLRWFGGHFGKWRCIGVRRPRRSKILSDSFSTPHLALGTGLRLKSVPIFTTLFIEHRRGGSAISSHSQECQHCQDFSLHNFRILNSGKSDFETRIKEALYIKYSRPVLNNQLINKGSEFFLNIIWMSLLYIVNITSLFVNVIYIATPFIRITSPEEDVMTTSKTFVRMDFWMKMRGRHGYFHHYSC